MSGAVAAVVAAIIVGFYFLPCVPGILPAQTTSAWPSDPGINYLPLTPGLSAYYDLGVDSGALITAVAPGSPADRAGIKVGDVIVSVNGARVEEDTSLLGVMRACPAGGDLNMECCRDKASRTVNLSNAQY